MASIKDIYKSGSFLKTTDIPKGKDTEFTIKSAKLEAVGDKDKLVLTFEDDMKWPLNKTNAERIAKNLKTDDYEKWTGKKIRIRRSETKYQGREIECLRVVREYDE